MSERPDRIPKRDAALAGAIAALASAIDVLGLARLKEVFLTFMSGNTSLMGRAIAYGDASRTGTFALVVALFVGGAMAGTWLGDRFAEHRRTTVMLAAVTLLLALATLWPAHEIALWVLAGGAVNAALSHVGKSTVGLTFVTGTLIRFSQGLARYLARHGDLAWVLQGYMWLCFLAGGILAGLLVEHAPAGTTWPVPLAALALTLLSLRRA